jgi:hypothetical protein
LRARSASNRRLKEAAEKLASWQLRAERVPPFEFYAELLDARHR